MIVSVQCTAVDGPIDQPLKAPSPGCFDKLNTCREKASRNCARWGDLCVKSCGLCPGMTPHITNDCPDKWKSCRSLASAGLCGQQVIKDNCKLSCNSCNSSKKNVLQANNWNFYEEMAPWASIGTWLGRGTSTSYAFAKLFCVVKAQNKCFPSTKHLFLNLVVMSKSVIMESGVLKSSRLKFFLFSLSIYLVPDIFSYQKEVL